jgi:disulfide bond formation protein DsbB
VVSDALSVPISTGAVATVPASRAGPADRILGMDAIGWLIIVVIALVVSVVAFVVIRRKRRGGGVIATKDKR